jgi:hypothetical protein
MSQREEREATGVKGVQVGQDFGCRLPGRRWLHSFTCHLTLEAVGAFKGMDDGDGRFWAADDDRLQLRHTADDLDRPLSPATSRASRSASAGARISACRCSANRSTRK